MRGVGARAHPLPLHPTSSSFLSFEFRELLGVECPRNAEEGARAPPPTRPTFHGSLGFRLHKLFLFDKASTISCSRGREGKGQGARLLPFPRFTGTSNRTHMSASGSHNAVSRWLMNDDSIGANGETGGVRRARAQPHPLPTHPQLEPLTLGPSFGNSEAPAGSFEPSLRYQMIPKGSNFQDSCSTSPRHLVVGNVEKCWNPGKGGGWVARASPPAGHLTTQEANRRREPSRGSCVGWPAGQGEEWGARARLGPPPPPPMESLEPSRSLLLSTGRRFHGKESSTLDSIRELG